MTGAIRGQAMPLAQTAAVTATGIRKRASWPEVAHRPAYRHGGRGAGVGKGQVIAGKYDSLLLG